MSRKTVLITDLDNTLFDWVAIWYASFSAMFQKIKEISGVCEDRLKAEIRSVHQIHGTSEYAFLIEELPSIRRAGESREEVLERFQPAIDAYRAARKNVLCLYPSVGDTLKALKASNTKVVGYTESMSFYSNYRVRKLALDGLLDVLFSPRDHDLPANLRPEDIRYYDRQTYRFGNTQHCHTPDGELKPNPDILLDIIKQIGASPDECLYIGDSLFKDVAMAQDAGVDDVWAKYGVAHSRAEYELLREVTHWTDEQVEYEKRIRARDVSPSYTLAHSFDQVTSIFDFGAD